MIIKQSAYLKTLLKARAADFSEWFIFDNKPITPKINVVKTSTRWDGVTNVSATVEFGKITIHLNNSPACDFLKAQFNGNKSEMPDPVADEINDAVLRYFSNDFSNPKTYFKCLVKGYENYTVAGGYKKYTYCLDDNYFVVFLGTETNYQFNVFSISVFSAVGAKSEFSQAVYSADKKGDFDKFKLELKKYKKNYSI